MTGECSASSCMPRALRKRIMYALSWHGTQAHPEDPNNPDSDLIVIVNDVFYRVSAEVIIHAVEPAGG